MKRLKITGYMSFLINGMIAVMTGTIVEDMVAEYGISYAMAGSLVAAQSIGNLIMVLLSGFVIQLIGRQRTLAVFPLLFSIGFGGVAFTSNVPLLFLFFTLTGLGWGLCNNIMNIIMMEDENAGEISILYTAYAIGSFLGPFLVVMITSFGGSWKTAVLLVSILALLLIPGFLIGNTGFATHDSKAGKLAKSDFYFLKNIRYYICIILYFGYIGTEVSINTWIVTFLRETSLLKKTEAQTLFSVFWLIVIFGRLFTGAYLKKIKREILLIFQWIGLAAGTTVLMFANNGQMTVVIVVIMAIFMSAISPVNAENADEFIKGKGISGGIMFAVGCAGSTILPKLVGNIADASGIRMGMKLINIVMYAMIIVNIVNILVKQGGFFYGKTRQK